MSDQQVKVMLWGMPRSLSSIFLKCMSGIPDSKMLFELYSCHNLMGPERVNGMPEIPMPPFTTNKTQEELEEDPGCGFPCSMSTGRWVKNHLETGYPEKKVIFVKELAPNLYGKYHLLPENGYRHAFLIRDPVKVMPSWSKMLNDMLNEHGVNRDFAQTDFDKMPHGLVPEGLGFKNMYELYRHIVENGLEEDPVIIDADDLLEDPAAMLKKFCDKLGLPYSDSLLTWNEGSEEIESWVVCSIIKAVIQKSASFRNFRTGTGFLKPKIKDPVSVSELPADIQRCIAYSVPYYKKMYEHRLK